VPPPRLLRHPDAGVFLTGNLYQFAREEGTQGFGVSLT